MPDCICASTPSGLTTGPQSMAQTTRWTRMRPFSTETSAACATTLPKDSCTAMPAACPAGSGLPQPKRLGGAVEHAPVA